MMKPMTAADVNARRRLESLPRSELRALQRDKLNALLEQILPQNQFYAEKLRDVRTRVRDLGELAGWPLTTKQELQPTKAAHTGAANRTYDLSRYVRYHRTSGTRGDPLVVLDTAADWQWWIDTWQFVLDAAEITPVDRAAMAFSFGPFIGFWTANDALAARGALVIPCGGMSSYARLKLICDEDVTVVCCTPSYALHLAGLARQEGIDLRKSTVRALIVAGEPGGSVPSIRARIEDAWNARLIDHAGATEVGPWGYSDRRQQGLHVVESEFIAEFLTLDTHRPGEDGELSELVLTSLGRTGAPLIRYRTGDLVRPQQQGCGDNHFVHLPGGVLGRVDDMMIVRGVNIFPSAVEEILHEFPEIVEYRLTVIKQGEMDALALEIEDTLGEPQRIARQLQLRLGLQIDVRTVPAGTLPRFELKGQRFIDQRK
jgi:phenylacetate-CoA ligase